MFNDDQVDYMKSLAATDPAKLCWCGWYQRGECLNRCDPRYSAADKLAVKCQLCNATPDMPNGRLIHRVHCENSPDRESYLKRCEQLRINAEKAAARKAFVRKLNSMDLLGMVCPRCDVEMVVGKAIKPKDGGLCRVYPLDEVLSADELEIIPVFKCPKCGHSDDGENRFPVSSL